MTYGFTSFKRKRRIFVEKYDDTFQGSNKKYGECNSLSKRQKFKKFDYRAESKDEKCNKSGIVSRSGAFKKFIGAGVFRQDISRLCDRFSIVLPYVAQFLDPMDVVCLLKVCHVDCGVYRMMGLKNKTECMIKFWMDKGKTFLWCWSNITTKRVRLEAIEYAKTLPNKREIGHKLFIIPLMR